MKNTILWVMVGGVVGCQTYDFEPVEPLAISQTTQSKTVAGRQPKPNLMLLIDKSGSMNYAADDTKAPCTANCNVSPNPACPAGCPTRLEALKTAMGSFLSANGTIAWMGMAIYPTAVPLSAGAANVCGATTSADVRVPLDPKTTDINAELTATANAVNSQIQLLTANGGTPTGDSLKFLGTYPPLLNPDPKFKRENFVVLLTDGLPNCNKANANSCMGTACRCTLAACTVMNYCTEGCLDKDNSAARATELKVTKNIKTIVIGFGAETASGDGPDTLNEIAEAGGFARPCKTDIECAVGTAACTGCCNVATETCNRKFYQASSSAELAKVLADISTAIDPMSICNYTLEETPSDPKFLAVIIDGKNEPGNTPDTWTYALGRVTFNGALCAKVTAATQANPVKVEFRIVTAL